MKNPAGDPTPIISRALPDGTLLETIYLPEEGATMLAIGQPSMGVRIAPDFLLSSGERLVPYSPANNLLTTGCVLLPSAVGDLGDKGDLVDEIRTYLHRYVDLSPTFEAIAAHYVLLTWIYDRFNELPYLRFRGDYGTGKTRALLTIGSICYKPFFASGASTVSPIFHVLDAFGGTLILDEADFRFSDATAELTKILNNGNIRGLPVLRTMTNRHRELNPTAFRVFGPKIVGMRERFSDRALESRFLSAQTGRRPLRSDISISLPDSLAIEACELRNKLLAWRFHARASIQVDRARLVSGVSARANQTAIALLSLVDDVVLRAEIANYLRNEEQNDASQIAATTEVRMIRAAVEAFETSKTAFVSIADVALCFNKSRESFHLPLNNKGVGAIIRKLGITTAKSRGVYVISQTERAKLTALLARHDTQTGATITVETEAAA